jgi:hypothetical protein
LFVHEDQARLMKDVAMSGVKTVVIGGMAMLGLKDGTDGTSSTMVD